MEFKFYQVVCLEVDLWDGIIVHVNEKSKDLEGVSVIIQQNIKKFPNGKWEIYPYALSMNEQRFN